MDLGANTANFQKKSIPFFLLQKKNSEFTTEISFCEFGFFFCKKKERILKVRRVGSQVHQKLSKSARILSEEKYSVSCLVLLVGEGSDEL